MTRRTTDHASGAPSPIGPYALAAHTDPGLVFLSGQTPIDPATGRLVDGDIATQTRQVFANLTAVLASAGLSLDDIVKVNVYLTSMADFADMNEIYLRPALSRTHHRRRPRTPPRRTRRDRSHRSHAPLSQPANARFCRRPRARSCRLACHAEWLQLGTWPWRRMAGAEGVDCCYAQEAAQIPGKREANRSGKRWK